MNLFHWGLPRVPCEMRSRFHWGEIYSCNSGVLVRRNFYPPFFWWDGGFHWDLTRFRFLKNRLTFWSGLARLL
jgi:hypothetical protein